MSGVEAGTFAQRSERQVGLPSLRVALDRASMRFTENRMKGFSSLPEADVVRDRARGIRLDVLRRLDELLFRFESELIASGVRVHWAPDAESARNLVVGIAREHEVRRIAKGKSMISEEIHLNEALRKADLTVVETDLGEYIIQVAEEAPSHIIVPAIHKTKEEIGALFRDRLGLRTSDRPEDLAKAARERLRLEFLEADMGISGVNFGVAESGVLALVENEGNGRMVTALPRVHVALMGIERIVETEADLSVMLSLLSRSATGQKLTSYNQWLRGPRRPGESDGPQELHVILVDNGRSRILGTEEAEILLCIRCGACLNVCPVYRGVGGHGYGSVYPGPVGAVLSPALEGLSRFPDLPHASTLCGACKEVCPVRIDIPRMLLHQRRQSHALGQGPFWLRMGIRFFRRISASPVAFSMFMRAGNLLLRVMARKGRVARLPWPFSAWTRVRDFPKPESGPLRPWMKSHGK